MVDRYGDAIEYDLHQHLGLDLVDFFRGRYSWRKLADLLDWLPTGSALWAARADDDEAAQAYLDRAGNKRRRAAARFPLRDMDPSTQLLMSVVDMLAVVSAKLEALGGGRPGTVKPVPRPLTAMERAEARAEAAQVDNLLDDVRRVRAGEIVRG